MKFKEKFNKGDIICSDKFDNGRCMTVDGDTLMTVSSSSGSAYKEFAYRCYDLACPKSMWFAYEHLKDSLDWRIATDEDINNYLTSFVCTKSIGE